MKNMMVTEIEDERWIDDIQRVVNEYNNKVHSTLKMSPLKASKKENKSQIILRTQNIHQEFEPKFKVGDVVRIPQTKWRFAKGYTPSWSKELFVVSEIKMLNPIVVELEDMNGHEIIGTFYEQELQK